MGDYLSAFLSSLPQGQQAGILKILDQEKSAGMIGTKEQMDAELERLVKMLASAKDFNSGLELQRPNPDQPGVVSSDMFNANFQSIYVALHGLFTQIERADVTVDRHRQVRTSDFSRIKAAVNKLAEDLSIFKFLRFTDEGWTEAKFSNFWERRNENTSAKAAEIDERTKTAILRIGRSRRLHQAGGSAPARVWVEPVGGGQTTSMSKSYKPENALDAKPETFWAHLVLADDPLTTRIDSVDYEGAMAYLVVELPCVDSISYVQLLPFGTHPVEVTRIEYWTGSAWVEVTGWTAQSASLDWFGTGFEEVQTDKIRILLRQPNYTRNVYLVPRRLFTNSLIWEMVLDQALALGVDEEELTGIQSAAVETNPRFRALLAGLTKFSERLEQSGLDIGQSSSEELTATVDAATVVMVGQRETDGKTTLNLLPEDSNAPKYKPEDVIRICKVEYLFGLYHVALESRDYFPEGVYESPKYDTQGTIYEIGLDTDESHVTDALGEPKTSVQYDIEISPERKIPVLPTGTTLVRELVKVNPNTLQGQLRLQATSVSTVYQDGVVVSGWTLVGSRTLQITSGFSRNSIYVVKYVPVAGQDSFDLEALYDSVELVKPEVFGKTDDAGMIQLSYYPFVAWEIVNDKVNWSKPDPLHAKYIYRVQNGAVVIDGIAYGPDDAKVYEPIKILVDGIQGQNITDYRGKVHPAFIAAPEQALVYQYIHVGRKIYFNRPIAGATIEVYYRWMAQYVRLVARLMGHQAVVNPYSPELRSYRLRLKTSRF